MSTVDINGTLVDFPDDLTPDQLQQAVSSAAQQIGGQQPQKGLMGRAWDALAIPEQKSREGLKMIAESVPQHSGALAGEMLGGLVPGGQGFGREIARRFPISEEPSGNLAQDIVTGAPKVAAETLAEFAPSFVSRGSIVTSGASKVLGATAPVVKPLLRAIGKQGEEMSGIAPRAEGALEAAYNDSSLMLSKGKKAAGELYEAAKAEMPQANNIFKGMYKPEEIMDTAKAYLAKGGKLEPTEALMARKAADSLLKSGRYVKDELITFRDTMDEMAKASGKLSDADKVYQRGVQAEALRNVFPQNKYGGASGFKTALGTFIAGLPGGKVLAAPALSPLTQGVLATGAGMAARQILGPVTSNGSNAAAVAALISEALRRRRANAGK